MMQTLPNSDLLRCILLNQPRGPNLACTIRDLTSGRAASRCSLWKETLAQCRERVTVARWNGIHLTGFASAHVRSGHRSWEIDRLFLAGGEDRSSLNGRGYRSDPQGVTLELLEDIVRQVGELRAERVFLRLTLDSAVFSVARRAGFFPCYVEALLEGPTGFSAGSSPKSAETPFPDWRKPLPEDNYPIFQLYCAATPQPVRTVAGLTFDQWRDGREAGGRRRSWVSKRRGRIIGWLGLSRCGPATAVEVMSHPEFPELWEEVVEQALCQEGPQRWLVPDYQDVVAQLLLRRQFHDTAHYLMMIKTVAVPVSRPGMAAVEA